MRAFLERTGGFAGMLMTAMADTEVLDPQEASQLVQLVEAADFFGLPDTIIPRLPQPDRFQYKLTVEDDQRSHTVTVSEAALPPQVRPLTDFLTRLAGR